MKQLRNKSYVTKPIFHCPCGTPFKYKKQKIGNKEGVLNLHYKCPECEKHYLISDISYKAEQPT